MVMEAPSLLSERVDALKTKSPIVTLSVLIAGALGCKRSCRRITALMRANNSRGLNGFGK